MASRQLYLFWFGDSERNGWAQGWICDSGVETSEDLGVDDIVLGLSRAGEKVALTRASEVSI